MMRCDTQYGGYPQGDVKALDFWSTEIFRSRIRWELGNGGFGHGKVNTVFVVNREFMFIYDNVMSILCIFICNLNSWCLLRQRHVQELDVMMVQPKMPPPLLRLSH